MTNNHYFTLLREDSSKVFVAVGYGFFVEMTHDEALRFIEKKTSQLTASVSQPITRTSFRQSLLMWTRANALCFFSFTEQLTKDSAKIKAHIRLVLEVSPWCLSALTCAPAHTLIFM